MTRALALLGLLVVLASAARSFVPEGTEALGSGRILAFGFLLLASVQMGHIMHPLRLPKLTGFLLAGALFGPELSGILTPRMLEDLGLVKKVSVGLIALLAGCELNIKNLRPKLRPIGASALCSFLIPMVMLFGLLGPSSLYLPGLSEMELSPRLAIALTCAVVLAASSPAVVVALLSEMKAAGPISDLTLSVVVLADLLVTVFFTFSLIVVNSSFPASTETTSLWGLAFHIFGSLGIGAILGVIFSVYIQRVKAWIGLFIFAVFFVVAEAGSVVHLDPLLVGLSAGLFLENLSPVSGHEVIKKTEPATMPSFAIFFAVVGAELKLNSLLDVLPLASAAMLVRALGMWCGAKLGGKLGKVEAPISRGLFFGLIPQAGVAIAFAGIIRTSFGDWGAKISTFLFGVIILNQLIGPVLFRFTLIRAKEAGQRKEDSTAAHPPHVAPEEEKSVYGLHVTGSKGNSIQTF
jgi:Kef-type K+ transport system membrane component KefB